MKIWHLLILQASLLSSRKKIEFSGCRMISISKFFIIIVTIMFCGCENCQMRVHLAPTLIRDAGQQESLSLSPTPWPPNWSICSGSHAIVFFRVPLSKIIARTGSKANMPEVTAALMGMERLEEGWVGGVQVWGHYMWDEYHVSSKESIFKLRQESSNKESFVVLH